jgi:hypothetical protein
MHGADARPWVIALMGPTASGKTALAIDWAQRYGGEIISVDSALVYRGLDIGSAKPTTAERAQAPHRLIDIREPEQAYSAGDFAVDARQAVSEVHAAGRLPLLVGGTGLYFRALFGGLSVMGSSVTPQRAAGPICTPSWCGSIRSQPRASTPPTRSASPARWRCSGSAAARSAPGRASRRRRRGRRSGCSS